MTILIAFHQVNVTATLEPTIKKKCWGSGCDDFRTRELPTVHRLGSEYLSADLCVSALVFWQVQRHLFYGLHRAQSLSQPPASPSTKCLKT